MAQLEGVGRVGWRNSVNVTGFTLNPDFAYSFRKVISTATLSCRVRRSSDNTEQNIGFVGNDLDNAALSAFVGAGNGFVVKIYDQKGSGKDLVQTTARSQYRIVENGVVYTLNGKATSRSAHGYMVTTSLFNPSVVTGASVFSVTKPNAFVGGIYNVDFIYSLGNGFTSVSERFLQNTISTSGTTPLSYNQSIELNTSLITTPYTIGTKLQSHLIKSGDNRFYQNNVLIGSNTTALVTPAVNQKLNLTTISWGPGTIGVGQADQFISEILIYNSYQNTAINDIHANINSYYSIY